MKLIRNKYVKPADIGNSAVMKESDVGMEIVQPPRCTKHRVSSGSRVGKRRGFGKLGRDFIRARELGVL